MAGEAFVGAHRATGVAFVAVGSIGLIALHGGSASGGIKGGEHTAQLIGEEELGGGAVGFADEAVMQAVVVGIALVGSAPIVDMLL